MKDLVSNILSKLQEFVTRESRSSPEAGAFNYESRFEVRITQPINSPYWPLYFFRFVCVNWYDSIYIDLFPESLLLQCCIWALLWCAAWPSFSLIIQRSLKASVFMKFQCVWSWMKWSTSHAHASWGSLKISLLWEVCFAHPDLFSRATNYFSDTNFSFKAGKLVYLNFAVMCWQKRRPLLL